MAMKIVNPIEAFAAWWGERPWQRRTLGSPARTKLMAYTHTLEKDAEAFAKFRGTPTQPRTDLLLPELGVMAKVFGDGWASEFGYDTMQGIRGIEAATAVRQNPLARADPTEGSV